MSKKFSIQLCSDVELVGMLIEVIYGHDTVAAINYEKGIDNIEIELPSNPENWTLPLDDFLVALEKAKKLAIKCAKEDTTSKD